MSVSEPPFTLNALTALADSTPGLDVLLLFGSRGRGDAHTRSDWDIGYTASSDVDAATLLPPELSRPSAAIASTS
jgi:hypothetical protein